MYLKLVKGKSHPVSNVLYLGATQLKKKKKNPAVNNRLVSSHMPEI